ncbi:MAG: trigger factor [Nitrospirae bacterium RBG_19FT_COMBO_42_15]|nr:MAG: trigger factor [Nitrospirae bacterium RBG_19FT_COMBO_42_15]
MKIDIQETTPTQRVIKIEIPADEVTQEFQRVSSDINKRVRVHGFRPGKAPLSIIEKNYKSEIEEDVLKKLVPDYYRRAIKDAGITPVDLPQIENVNLNKDAPLTFTVKIEIRPKFDVAPYEGIEIIKKDASVTKDDVDKVIDRLRDRLSTLESREDGHLILEGDFAVVDAEGLINGEPFKDGVIKDHMIEIGSKNFIEGVEEKLIGHKKNENIEVKINYPEDHQNKDLAGNEMLFKMNIKEVKKKILPNLDDEFAKDIGGFASFDELRKKIEEDLEAQKGSINRESYRKDVLKKLVDGTSFDVSPVMVEKELRYMLYNAKQQSQQYGKAISEDEEENLKKEYEPIAMERVKGFLILDVIADKENVSVSNEEVEAEIRRMAASMNQNIDELKKYIKSKEGVIENIIGRLREDKTLDIIVSKAVFKEAA